MRLDKEEVAARQLDTAIRLLFDGGDVVSVHTLACAAANVLRDMLKAKGGEAWQDAIIKSYPGFEGQIHQTLVRAQNFFKHANRDPKEELDFDERTNDETIIVATLSMETFCASVRRQDEPRQRLPCLSFNCGIWRKIRGFP